jgi:hypothetical protein
VKNHAHWRAFETVFEVYFSLRGASTSLDDEGDGSTWRRARRWTSRRLQGEGGGAGQGRRGLMTPEELAEMLYQSLLKGDQAMMRAIARQAVKRFAGMEPGRPVGGTYYLYRTLRNLDLDGMLER